MTYAFIVLVLAYFGTVAGFLKFLHEERKRTDQREQNLLNRIQAPETGVAESIEPSDEPQYVTEDDEDRRFLLAEAE